jgi:hypothetical protein
MGGSSRSPRYRRRTIDGAGTKGAASTQAFSAFVIDSPWQIADLGRLLVRLGLALVALLITWYGAAHTAHVNRQFYWLVGGAAAAAVGVAGVVAWETAGLARVRFLKLELVDVLTSQYASPHPTPRSSSARVSAQGDGAVRVTASGMRLYHRVDCQLAVGKQVRVVSADQIKRAGLAACGVCGA